VVATASQRLAVPTCQPWIFANARAAGYYRTAYEPAAFDRLRQEVGSLSTSERIMLASDAWAQIRSGRQDASSFLGLVESLQSDRTSAMIDVLAEPVSFIGRYLTTPASKPRYQAWVRRIFGPMLKELGWSVRHGEPEDVAAVRAAVVNVLGAVGDDPDVNAQARRLAVRSIQQPGSVDPTLLVSVVQLAARQGDATLYGQFLAAYRAAKTPDDRRLYLTALGGFRDPALIRRTIDFTFSPDVRTQDAGYLLASLIGTEGGLDQAWPLLRDRWSDVAKKVPPFFGLTGPIDALGSGCDAGLADQLRTFFEVHPPEGADRTLQQSLESIGSCAALARAQTRALEQALSR
jgi:aminopeptidase N